MDRVVLGEHEQYNCPITPSTSGLGEVNQLEVQRTTGDAFSVTLFFYVLFLNCY
jgi:hypothetical protein